MPLPKALQQAINDAPTPQEGSVFDFESGNPVVKLDDATIPDVNSDVDTSKEGWLENLLSDETPAVDAPTLTPDSGFMSTDSLDGGSPLPDIGDDKGNDQSAQISELKDILTSLEGRFNKSDQAETNQKALDEAMVKLKEKYGDVDPELISNFSELHQTFRASLGQEIESELVRTNLANDTRIKELEGKIEQLLALPRQEEPQQPNAYRDLMAETIPDYTKIVQSDKFKRLLEIPVDADNPEFTYNQKLGRLYSQKRTSDIIKFFSSFADKYIAGDKSNGAVVDGGSSSLSQGGQGGNATLNQDRLRSIFKKVMNGELTLSADEMNKLRTMAAKQAMK